MNENDERLVIEPLPNVPLIKIGDDLIKIIFRSVKYSNFKFQNDDVLCISSKVVSLVENQIIDLNEIKASRVALELHKKIPRKDPRLLQVIINETKRTDLSRIDLDNNYIAGWLPNGYRLTSSGVDKLNEHKVILLPRNPDKSAKRIGKNIYKEFKKRVAIVITDSDGRIEKKGSTQIAIGIYGLPALRITKNFDSKDKENTSEETLCDLVSAAAGLIMGQRNNNRPMVIIRNLKYKFDKTSHIKDALSRQ